MLFSIIKRRKTSKKVPESIFFEYAPFIHKLHTSFAIGRIFISDILNPRQPENLGWKEAGLQLAGAGSHARSYKPVEEVYKWVGPERAIYAAK